VGPPVRVFFNPPPAASIPYPAGRRPARRPLASPRRFPFPPVLQAFNRAALSRPRPFLSPETAAHRAARHQWRPPPCPPSTASPTTPPLPPPPIKRRPRAPLHPAPLNRASLPLYAAAPKDARRSSAPRRRSAPPPPLLPLRVAQWFPLLLLFILVHLPCCLVHRSSFWAASGEPAGERRRP
jgi:hypothetical protein